MNLRALAEKDLCRTLTDATSGGACEICFCDASGNEHTLNARVGDIGFGYDTDGNKIAARQVWVSWRLSDLLSDDGEYLEPGRGWTCDYTDLSGKEWTAAVTYGELDRTIGIGRAWLSFDFSGDAA